jgi:hypothetical protein
VASGKVLDIPAFSKTPETPVQQWEANGGSNQQWRFEVSSLSNYANSLSIKMTSFIAGGGVTLQLTGSGFEASSFTPRIINGPGWNGESAYPMSAPFNCDAHGNFNLQINYHYEYDSQPFPGPVLIVLEDAQGTISAMATCPQSWFPSSQAG